MARYMTEENAAKYITKLLGYEVICLGEDPYHNHYYHFGKVLNSSTTVTLFYVYKLSKYFIDGAIELVEERVN